VKVALITLMSIFVIGNLLSAMAPGYWTLLAARLVTSLNHGAFFGLGSVVAANLVPKDKQASAVATMFMGLTIANIGGVPAATWIGQQIGWRMAFAAPPAWACWPSRPSCLGAAARRGRRRCPTSARNCAC
jgi:DHA1 family inner membrane transport protein